MGVGVVGVGTGGGVGANEGGGELVREGGGCVVEVAELLLCCLGEAGVELGGELGWEGGGGVWEAGPHRSVGGGGTELGFVG